MRWVSWSVLVLGCYNPAPQSGQQQCGPKGECADGYFCAADNHCYKKGGGPAPDAAAPRDLARACTSDTCKGTPTPHWTRAAATPASAPPTAATRAAAAASAPTSPTTSRTAAPAARRASASTRRGTASTRAAPSSRAAPASTTATGSPATGASR